MTTQMSILSQIGPALWRLFQPGDYRRRYGDTYKPHSVDYRQNRRLVRSGIAPAKTRRIAALVPGDTIVDVGAGEGILALELAAVKARVRAIDITPRRHRTAQKLQQTWAGLGRKVDNCEMILGDAVVDPSLMDGFDTLIASHVIYYFRDQIDPFLAEAAKRVRFVCLVGNATRNRRYAGGRTPFDIGEYIIYSTPQGMRALMERHGFEIVEVADVGDPVVIGKRIEAD